MISDRNQYESMKINPKLFHQNVNKISLLQHSINTSMKFHMQWNLIAQKYGRFSSKMFHSFFISNGINSLMYSVFGSLDVFYIAFNLGIVSVNIIIYDFFAIRYWFGLLSNN